MRLLRKLGRILLFTTAAYCAAVVLLLASLYLDATITRHRAERLMADFQAVELYKTQWPQAQAHITKWGRYGHYQGTCNASFCRDTIQLGTIAPAGWFANPSPLGIKVFLAAIWLLRPPFYLLGPYVPRTSFISTSLVVQDGIVIRKSDSIVVADPPLRRGDYSYSLIAGASAFSRVTTGRFLQGNISVDDQLAQHPNYAAARPGGCTICMEAIASFSPRSTAAEIRSLTTFNLHCIDRLRPCESLDELYPASQPWHLYDFESWSHPDKPYVEQPPPPPSPLACKIPLWVRGREAHTILAVTPIAEQQTWETEPYAQEKYLVEHATLKINEILKQTDVTRYNAGRSDREEYKAPSVGDRMTSTTHASRVYTPVSIETPLIPGSAYLMMTGPGYISKSDIFNDRCLVVPDIPANRAELLRGAALNDHPRIPSSDNWPYNEE